MGFQTCQDLNVTEVGAQLSTQLSSEELSFKPDYETRSKSELDGL